MLILRKQRTIRIKPGDYYKAHNQKIHAVAALVGLYAVPNNLYNVEKCIMDLENDVWWDNIVVYSRDRAEVKYQLMNEDQWARVHLAGSVRDLMKVTAELVDDINDRGW